MEFLNVLDKGEEAKKKLMEMIEFHKIPLEQTLLTFSGGKDSTVCLKMIEELGLKNKIKIAFMNTLMEYEATYEFIKEKEEEGGNIIKTEPKLPAPLIYKKYGKPFLSKKSSEMLSRMIKHNFDFINDTYKDRDYLLNKYSNLKASILGFTNYYTTFGCPKGLKEKLVKGELNFKVSNKCCEFLKKKPVYEINKN